MPQLDEARVKHQLSSQRSAALDNLAVAQALAEQLNEYLSKAFTALNRAAEKLPEDTKEQEQIMLESEVPGYKEWKQQNGTSSVSR